MNFVQLSNSLDEVHDIKLIPPSSDDYKMKSFNTIQRLKKATLPELIEFVRFMLTPFTEVNTYYLQCNNPKHTFTHHIIIARCFYNDYYRWFYIELSKKEILRINGPFLSTEQALVEACRLICDFMCVDIIDLVIQYQAIDYEGLTLDEYEQTITKKHQQDQVIKLELDLDLSDDIEFTQKHTSMLSVYLTDDELKLLEVCNDIIPSKNGTHTYVFFNDDESEIDVEDILPGKVNLIDDKLDELPDDKLVSRETYHITDTRVIFHILYIQDKETLNEYKAHIFTK